MPYTIVTLKILIASLYTPLRHIFSLYELVIYSCVLTEISIEISPFYFYLKPYILQLGNHKFWQVSPLRVRPRGLTPYWRLLVIPHIKVKTLHLLFILFFFILDDYNFKYL